MLIEIINEAQVKTSRNWFFFDVITLWD